MLLKVKWAVSSNWLPLVPTFYMVKVLRGHSRSVKTSFLLFGTMVYRNAGISVPPKVIVLSQM